MFLPLPNQSVFKNIDPVFAFWFSVGPRHWFTRALIFSMASAGHLKCRLGDDTRSNLLDYFIVFSSG